MGGCKTLSKKLLSASISPKNSLVEEIGHENPVWETKEQKDNNFLLPAYTLVCRHKKVDFPKGGISQGAPTDLIFKTAH